MLLAESDTENPLEPELDLCTALPVTLEFEGSELSVTLLTCFVTVLVEALAPSRLISIVRTLGPSEAALVDVAEDDEHEDVVIRGLLDDFRMCLRSLEASMEATTSAAEGLVLFKCSSISFRLAEAFSVALTVEHLLKGWCARNC